MKLVDGFYHIQQRILTIEQFRRGEFQLAKVKEGGIEGIPGHPLLIFRIEHPFDVVSKSQ